MRRVGVAALAALALGQQRRENAVLGGERVRPQAPAQRQALVYRGFVSTTGTARLAHLPRYLQAALERVRQLGENPGRDRQRMTEYERSLAAFTQAGGTIPLPTDASASLHHARWLLEELRVSLWAQQLGTAEPVSAQRIAKALTAG